MTTEIDGHGQFRPNKYNERPSDYVNNVGMDDEQTFDPLPPLEPGDYPECWGEPGAWRGGATTMQVRFALAKLNGFSNAEAAERSGSTAANLVVAGAQMAKNDRVRELLEAVTMPEDLPAIGNEQEQAERLWFLARFGKTEQTRLSALAQLNRASGNVTVTTTPENVRDTMAKEAATNAAPDVALGAFMMALAMNRRVVAAGGRPVAPRLGLGCWHHMQNGPFAPMADAMRAMGFDPTEVRANGRDHQTPEYAE